MVIRELVRSSAVTNEADAIILTGGTGIAPRDVTPEAIEPIFDKRLDGFGEEFRRRSWSSPASSPWRESGADKALGSRAMLARVTAGTVSGTLVVALPGSPAAAELGASLLVDVLPHAIDVMLGRHAHKINARARFVFCRCARRRRHRRGRTRARARTCKPSATSQCSSSKRTRARATHGDAAHCEKRTLRRIRRAHCGRRYPRAHSASRGRLIVFPRSNRTKCEPSRVASARSCVTKRITAPSFARDETISPIAMRAASSSAEKGSSRRRSFRFETSARAKASRCFSPPERRSGFPARRRSTSPTSASVFACARVGRKRREVLEHGAMRPDRRVLRRESDFSRARRNENVCAASSNVRAPRRIDPPTARSRPATRQEASAIFPARRRSEQNGDAGIGRERRVELERAGARANGNVERVHRRLHARRKIAATIDAATIASDSASARESKPCCIAK